ncbi:hypothetical protein [Tahibacter sp.]|uniref:hypothetical protein n=1 Tax=Tahibacter sp. TaxID=2056211 RepID=UPI0028C50B7B|nr:hypothetical protein [Tahibacter sp.]
MLVLSVLQVQAPFEVLYPVYRELTEKSAPAKPGDYQVGSIRAFDALKPDHGDGAHARQGSGEGRFCSVNMTDLLRRLSGSKSVSEKPVVTMRRPASRPARAGRW